VYSVREVVKRVDGYAIFSIPADIDDENLPALGSRLCVFITKNTVPGITFDFSNLHSIDRHICHALIQLMQAVSALGVATNVAGICAGIAATLALLDTETDDIRAFGTLDICIADLKEQNSKRHIRNRQACPETP